jgi:hypothetical protein
VDNEHHDHSQDEHGHSHGLVDRSVIRSRDGVKTVAISLAFSALPQARSSSSSFSPARSRYSQT